MPERFAPTFLIQIEGEQLSSDITQKITNFVYEDCEDQDDLLEITLEGDITLADDPLLQEGNIISARWGYVDEWSDIKECVLKEPEYEFGDTVRVKLKAYDNGAKLKGKSSQKIWKNKTYTQIAKELADKYKLKAIVDDTKEVIAGEPQGNKSDFTFLSYLADKIGYQFYIQGNELHFHKRNLNKKPLLTLTYRGKDGLLLSFHPKVKTQGSKGEGTETKAVGFDPMAKKAVIHEANDGNTNQTVLGKKTLMVDGATGEEKYEAQETGKIIPCPEQTKKDNQALAESVKQNAQLDQLEAEATVIGIPTIAAKEIIEIAGVGNKFSGNYYIKQVRHEIGAGGYLMTLDLKRNAVGKSSEKAANSQGKENKQHGQSDTQPKMITVDAETGKERLET
ncbi:MAG: phage late control D family protein [Candidatus Schekmanbacteria bacterium]|nr:phage late control D family protein [Candidatus Schekmanbacteria bacterium]